MSSDILVTGGSGFVGQWLIRCLTARGDRVCATTTAARPPPDTAELRWRRLELPDIEQCRRTLAEASPAAVVHLAAVTAVPDAERSPDRALDVNVRGTDQLLRALEAADPGGSTRFVYVSTGQVYDARSRRALTEDAPLWPANTYARTKLAAEIVCAARARSGSRSLVVLRPFNHAGPEQSDRMAVSSFARQVARIELGLAAPVLETGDLSCERDFCDVRDVCEAYALAVDGAVPDGTFNVASGRATPLADIVDILSGAARCPFEVRTVPSRLRDGDIDSLRGSAAALESASGWRARRSLETTVLDTLRWWREKEHA